MMISAESEVFVTLLSATLLILLASLEPGVLWTEPPDVGGVWVLVLGVDGVGVSGRSITSAEASVPEYRMYWLRNVYW